MRPVFRSVLKGLSVAALALAVTMPVATTETSAQTATAEKKVEKKKKKRDPRAKIYRTKSCMACHGRNGARAIRDYPNLAGQNEKYLKQQMLDIQSGKRVASIEEETGHPRTKGMADVMHLVNKKEIGELAKWLSELPPAKLRPPEEPVSEEQIAAGKKAYKKLGCKACHGKDGTKASNKAYPLIAGQKRAYLINQMTDMREKVRVNGKSKLMYGVIKRAKDDQIAAIADYLSTVERKAKKKKK
ncbi:MAG: c-type cytochrome [Cohaesibacter sp.]|jgi:cytochrome c553|nr:c-type cytochrome [Cohaesibacter sp.]